MLLPQRSTSPGSNHPWGLAEPWLLARKRSCSRSKADCLMCDMETVARCYARTTDGRPSTRQNRSRTFIYKRWVRRVRTVGSTDQENKGVGAANSKRWGLVFTCLASRAIHIELVETMDASSFLCALWRFFAIRGPALRLRCDRGTNFVGVTAWHCL